MRKLEEFHFKKTILLLIYLCFAIFSCEKENKEFEIKGKIKGVNDGTFIYLSHGNALDSCLISNNQFNFKGSIIPNQNAILYLNNPSSSKLFWIDTTKLHIQSKTPNLENCIVMGGKAQREMRILEERRKINSEEINNIINRLKAKDLDSSVKDSLILKYRDIQKKTMDINKNFVEEYPSSIVSAYMLNRYKKGWGVKISKEMFSQMSDDVKETHYGISIARFINLAANLTIGDRYVDFEQLNTVEQKVKFSDIRADYTLIDFWASWCKPCRISNKNLKILYNKYKSEGFTIVSISLDENKTNWINAIKEDALTWDNLTDLRGKENEAAIVYNVDAIPDNVLIDSNGIIIGRNMDSVTLNRKLKKIFLLN